MTDIEYPKRIKAEAHLDRKYLLPTRDDSLRPIFVALRKDHIQLLELERAFVGLKTSLEIQPLYHLKGKKSRPCTSRVPKADFLLIADKTYNINLGVSRSFCLFVVDL